MELLGSEVSIREVSWLLGGQLGAGAAGSSTLFPRADDSSWMWVRVRVGNHLFACAENACGRFNPARRHRLVPKKPPRWASGASGTNCQGRAYVPPLAAMGLACAAWSVRLPSRGVAVTSVMGLFEGSSHRTTRVPPCWHEPSLPSIHLGISQHPVMASSMCLLM